MQKNNEGKSITRAAQEFPENNLYRLEQKNGGSKIFSLKKHEGKHGGSCQ